jgi:hypothetical protein
MIIKFIILILNFAGIFQLEQGEQRRYRTTPCHQITMHQRIIQRTKIVLILGVVTLVYMGEVWG